MLWSGLKTKSGVLKIKLNALESHVGWLSFLIEHCINLSDLKIKLSNLQIKFYNLLPSQVIWLES